ncbi:MAG: prephenate dehydrogenase [Chloroflexota bacterium]|nr:MAG: hypothetical protein DIU68_06140 [Chloroflexota bacterium]
MTTITVGILGLGRLGASVGLALRRYNSRKGAKHEFQTAGVDSSASARAAAEKSGAVERIARTYAEAAANRDIIILALPYSEVASAYREIGLAARPGAVVIDLSPLKSPSLEWADERLPEGVFMVGATPVLNPDYLFDGLDSAEYARADLFDRGAWLLTPGRSTAKEAVELASDFAEILGATPHFMDPLEHDTLSAATEGLPALFGLALFRMLAQANSWEDTQRVTNASFGRATHHLEDTHPDDLRDFLLNNRRNLLPHLDALLATLRELRAVLERGDREALEVALIDAAQTYNAWLARRRSGRWDDRPEQPGRSVAGSLMSGLMGEYLSKRLRRDSKDDE